MGHHFGVRRLLHADFPPLKKPAFTLDGIDIVLEPAILFRGWRTLGVSPASPVSWSLEEHRTRLRQLAKLKFNQIVLTPQAWQPFVHFEHGGIKKRTGVLWTGPQYRVDGETAGRAAFNGEDVFNNPDFKDAKTYEQRVQAGVKLMRGIIKEAKSLGMTVTIQFDGLENARELSSEFRPLLSKDMYEETGNPLTIMVKTAEPLANDLAQAQITAYQKTYPQAEYFVIWSTSSGGKNVVLSQGPARLKICRLITLGNLDGSVLPQFDLSQLHESIKSVREKGGNGFVAECQLPDDLNTSVYYLSRAGFDASMNPEKAISGLVNPICGDGVGARIAIGFDNLARASRLIEKHDATIATPRADVVLRHYNTMEAVPEWWAEAKNGFVMAMNEMYRGNTRARGGARAFSLYHAKRFEFALHYFTCLEEVRQAGIARAQKKKDEQLEHLDKAVEAIHNALGAMADVDRNNGDRGVIATLNEYAYRPLLKELEQADR